MAFATVKEQLTNRQIMMVAAEISEANVKIIAEELMGFDADVIETIATETDENDVEAFKRNVIKRWANRNSECQVKVRQTCDEKNRL